MLLIRFSRRCRFNSPYSFTFLFLFNMFKFRSLVPSKCHYWYAVLYYWQLFTQSPSPANFYFLWPRSWTSNGKSVVAKAKITSFFLVETKSHSLKPESNDGHWMHPIICSMSRPFLKKKVSTWWNIILECFLVAVGWEITWQAGDKC